MADRPYSAASSKSSGYSRGITSAAQGDAKFQDMYEKALLRKRLFKEYISRNQVLERFNSAIEALFECEMLPEDPVAWIADWVKANPQSVAQNGWSSMPQAPPPSAPPYTTTTATASAPSSRPVSARTGLTTRVSSGGSTRVSTGATVVTIPSRH